MQFNSYIFVLFFLPIALLGYYLLNKRSIKSANVFLLGMSLWFYGYFNTSYLLIICSSIVINYLLSRILVKIKKHREVILVIALCFNVGLIFYYKYYDFFISNLNFIFRQDFALKHILLPLGISFFTFQQISYVVDSYYGKTVDYGFIEYALYVAYFPQLIAGPIVLHDEIIPQFRDRSRRSVNWDNMGKGILIFSIGLFKKMEIADTFGRIVDWGFSNLNTASSLDLFIVMISFTFQIYFDFSGYSDMAIGLGKMFNFDLPMNFNSPYRALSVVEYWDRWHLTLTRFLRTYIFNPIYIRGKRKDKNYDYLAIFITFFVSGLWHGAAWTYVIYGCAHGVANILTHAFRKPYKKIPKVIRWLLTFSFVSVFLLLFRSQSLKQWTQVLGGMLRFDPPSVNIVLGDTFFTLAGYVANALGHVISDKQIFAIAIAVFIPFILYICIKGKNIHEMELKLNKKSLTLTVLMLSFCIITFSRESYYIYFNF